MCHICEEATRKQKLKTKLLTIIGVVIVIILFGIVGRMDRNIEMMPSELSTGEYDYYPL